MKAGCKCVVDTWAELKKKLREDVDWIHLAKNKILLTQLEKSEFV
jgi:hypothetical protein